jgi:hypothetical protein
MFLEIWVGYPESREKPIPDPIFKGPESAILHAGMEF